MEYIQNTTNYMTQNGIQTEYQKLYDSSAENESDVRYMYFCYGFQCHSLTHGS